MELGHSVARHQTSGRWLPPGLKGYRRAWLGGDVIAGLTLAAVAIPECMGYTRIAGTPVVTGLYTLLLPVVAFAILGSSRHLVVGADSATAAILFAGLVGFVQPGSDQWLQLASVSALLTAGLLFVARILRLGFLADFLSRTVLVGFLSGVGVSLLVSELPDMLGITVGSSGFLPRLADTIQSLPATHPLTLAVSAGTLLVILVGQRLNPRLPSALAAVALAIAVTWLLGLDHQGIAVVGSVPPGLPVLRFPETPPSDVVRLIPTSLSMFLVVLAQSAATSRSIAQEHAEPLDQERDLVALGVANLLAGLSSTFVVNGSPTKTAVVDSAGGRTQVAQVVMACMTLLVLLAATGLIEYLPNATLSALVFLIGARLIDLRALRRMYRLTRGACAVALGTLVGVVVLGVEQGIFLAIGLSILDHLRREYHPKDMVLTWAGSHAKARPATPGVETEPGLVVYRFESELFFANADYFAERVQALVAGAPHPVQWLVLDLVSLSDIDYTGGLRLVETITRLQGAGTTVALVEADAVGPDLERYGIAEQVGRGHIFATVQASVEAFRSATLSASAAQAGTITARQTE